MSGNQLNGSIPDGWGTHWAALKALSLTNNRLSGSVPSTFGATWTVLTSLGLGGNKFDFSLKVRSLFLSQYNNRFGFCRYMHVSFLIFTHIFRLVSFSSPSHVISLATARGRRW